MQAVSRAQDPPARRSGASLGACWGHPPPGFSKINVDASWSMQTCMGFVGIVVRDADGLFVAAIRHLVSASCAAAAEAVALVKGCELGLFLGLRKVVVESDSKDSIRSLSESLGFGSWRPSQPW